MAHARASNPHFVPPQNRPPRHPRPLSPRSEEVRAALGSDGGKSNGGKALGVAAEIPERFATRANRSERIAQALETMHCSPVFGSASRGRLFSTRDRSVGCSRKIRRNTS
jgi:hypothetical protein